MDRLINQVIATKDYGKFKFIEGNRKPDPFHVSALKNSMSAKQLQIPIIVNEYMEIIDGQHRFRACQELGLQVYFIKIEGYGLEEVTRCNLNQKNWSTQNYLDMYILENIEDYIYFAEVIEKYGIRISDVFVTVSRFDKASLNDVRALFLRGDLKITNRLEIENFLSQFNDLRQYVAKTKEAQLLKAFIELYTIQAPFVYNHNQLISKLEKYGYRLRSGRNKDELLEILCSAIYSVSERNDSKIILYNVTSKKFHS